MTLGNISSLITFLTNASTSVFTDAQRLISINRHLNNVQTLILRSQDEWDFDDSNNTDFPILTASLVANQAPYTLPTGTLKVKRLETSYDGTNFHKVSPIDINERMLPTATNALGDFTSTDPYYDLQSNVLWLYPTPTAASVNGLKIWIERGPLEFTSGQLTAGTVEPGFDSLFHDVLAYGAALDFCIARNLSQTETIKREFEEKKTRLQNHYGNKQEDRVMNIKTNSVNYK